MKRITYLAVVCMLGVGPGSAKADDLINIDFNSTVDGSGGAGTYSGAAVLGSAGDTWNGITGNFFDAGARSNLALVTSSGAASSATLSFSGQNGFYDTSQNRGVYIGDPKQALMTDYALTRGTATFTFNGLTPGGTYRLILYSASNFTDRDTIFTVNGSSQTVVTPDTNFVLGDGYADFTTTADGSGNLSFTTAAGTHGEGDLDGLQLQAEVATPEPASLTLFGIGAVGLIGYIRRQRKRAAPHDRN